MPTVVGVNFKTMLHSALGCNVLAVNGQVVEASRLNPDPSENANLKFFTGPVPLFLTV